MKARLQKAIQNKIDGKEITVQETPAAPQIVDIMTTLHAGFGMVQKQV